LQAVIVATDHAAAVEWLVQWIPSTWTISTAESNERIFGEWTK